MLKETEDSLLQDCVVYAQSRDGITAADLQKKFKLGYRRAQRIMAIIKENGCKNGGHPEKINRKKKFKMVTVEAPFGSIIIPPNKIKKLFKLVFNAGMKCQEMHPDDDTYDNIHFHESLNKVLKSFPKNARPY